MQSAAHSTVEQVRDLRDLILEHRDTTESDRKLAEPVVEALHGSGLFHLAVPSDLGGPDVPFPDVLEVLEELGAAEGAVAWVIWNGLLPVMFGRRYLAEEPRREILGGRGSRFVSSTRPSGMAVAENGGYRLSGRWSLVSGCMHADWVALMHVVGRDGEPEMLEPGVPHLRLAFVPMEECRILDTWHVGGLRGTGSHDLVVEDVQVPAERSFAPSDETHPRGPLDHMPLAASMGAGHAAFSLGMAREAVGTVLALAREKVSVDPGPGMAERPAVLAAVATARSRIAVQRSALHGTVGSLWEKAQGGERPSLEELADLWALTVTTSRTCRELVNTMYELAGASSLYRDSPLERCQRDIQAMTQHVVCQPFWLEDAGRVALGAEPTHPLFAL